MQLCLGQSADECLHGFIIRCVQCRKTMGQLTTHVLDIRVGLPAAGVRIELSELQTAPKLLVSTVTGKDGRCPAPLMAGADFRAGRYALTFYLAEYFRSLGVELPVP